MVISKTLDRVNVVVIDKEVVSGLLDIDWYPQPILYRHTISNTHMESGIFGNNRGKALVVCVHDIFC